MITKYHIQLGSIRIPVEPCPGSSTSTFPVCSEEWLPFDSEQFFSSRPGDEPREATVENLARLASDPGLGFTAQYQSCPGFIWIRVALLPSDAPGSTWKRTAHKARGRASALQRLFKDLQKSWNQELAPWLLGHDVSLLSPWASQFARVH
jgi:hypothetical protein